MFAVFIQCLSLLLNIDMEIYKLYNIGKGGSIYNRLSDINKQRRARFNPERGQSVL